MRIPDRAVDVNLGAGRATLEMANVALDDDIDIAQAIVGNPPPDIPSHASFTVQWQGVSKRKHVRNQNDRFALEAIESEAATIEWSARHDSSDFSYVSDPANMSQTVFAELAVERNGKFFS